MKTRRDDRKDVLSALMEDPTVSNKQMAQELGVSRQKLWRMRKELEETGEVWGYTAVMGPGPDVGTYYVILFQTRNIDNGLADRIMATLKRDVPLSEGVKVMEALHLMGEYDAMITILAENSLAARRYYDRLSTKYSDYMLQRPIMMEASFAIRLGGKVNPRIEKFRDLIPDIDHI